MWWLTINITKREGEEMFVLLGRVSNTAVSRRIKGLLLRELSHGTYREVCSPYVKVGISELALFKVTHHLPQTIKQTNKKAIGTPVHRELDTIRNKVYPGSPKKNVTMSQQFLVPQRFLWRDLAGRQATLKKY